MKRKEITMSAYSQAANGFVVSDRVTLMLNTLHPEARKRILARAYDIFFKLEDTPLLEPREEQAAKAVVIAATEIAVSFKRRQKQSREARQVGAANREIVVRASNDNREMVSEERRKEEVPPTPPIEEKSKEDNNNTPPKPPVVRSVFKPPTVEEVAAYCKERNNSIDAQSFVDFYQAREWRYSGNIKMKDWKAAVRNWENRRKHEQSTVGRIYGIPSKGLSGIARTPTAGNFRGGTAEQRAEAETVL